MLIDTHVHVGQFRQDYYSPSLIHELMSKVGVSYYAVSSTTQCEENYPKVLDEMRKLIELDGDKVLPTMWITPEGLKGNIAWHLESDIKWKMLKIHPWFNQSSEWVQGKGLIREVVEIARELHVPILIHTGYDDCCKCSLFEQSFKENPDIIFILAHGRPLDETIRIVGSCPNVFVDTAFVELEGMKAIIEAGLSHKLLWGSDVFIPKFFYPDADMEPYYLRELKAFKDNCTAEQYAQVTAENAAKLFGLS